MLHELWKFCHLSCCNIVERKENEEALHRMFAEWISYHIAVMFDSYFLLKVSIGPLASIGYGTLAICIAVIE